MDKSRFTWYRAKQKMPQSEMEEIYGVITEDMHPDEIKQFDGFLNQIYESGFHSGSDSSDGSYSKSWENVR